MERRKYGKKARDNKRSTKNERKTKRKKERIREIDKRGGGERNRKKGK